MIEHRCGEGRMPEGSTPGAAVKVLGSGCDRMTKFGENVLAALTELGMPAEVEYIIDIFKISEYDVMNNPGLVVDGKVVSEGIVLDKDEIIEILKKVR